MFGVFTGSNHLLRIKKVFTLLSSISQTHRNTHFVSLKPRVKTLKLKEENFIFFFFFKIHTNVRSYLRMTLCQTPKSISLTRNKLLGDGGGVGVAPFCLCQIIFQSYKNLHMRVMISIFPTNNVCNFNT